MHHFFTRATASGFLSLALLAGCGGGTAETIGLRIDGAVDRPASNGLRDLQAQPAVTQTVTFNSGTTPQTHTYTGANLWALISAAGLQTDATRKNDVLNRYVLATGADGYRAVLSLGELNPEFGNKASLVAYAETVNGTPAALSAADGPYRATAPGDIKGGRYVSNLVRLDVRASGSTATGTGGTSPSFAVSGAVTRPMAFDLAVLQQLPVASQTVGGSVYTGVSLWTLLNGTTGLQFDAAVKNASLAMYAVATGSDGYKALVALGEIDPGFGNRQVLVAYSANGAALGTNGAFRLVVPGDIKLGRSVSNLVSVEVFTAAAAP